MAYGDPYITLEEFRRRLNVQSNAEDAFLTAALEAASAAIDAECGRQFNGSTVDEVRYVDARFTDVIELEQVGIRAVTEFAVDDGADGTYATIWPASSFRLLPLNPKPGFPYRAIERIPHSGYAWPYGVYARPRAIRITGLFGWAAVPGAVQMACYIIAKRYRERWAAPFGVVGGGELGTGPVAIPGLDRDVRRMLAGYKTLPAV